MAEQFDTFWQTVKIISFADTKYGRVEFLKSQDPIFRFGVMTATGYLRTYDNLQFAVTDYRFLAGLPSHRTPRLTIVK